MNMVDNVGIQRGRERRIFPASCSSSDRSRGDGGMPAYTNTIHRIYSAIPMPVPLFIKSNQFFIFF
jgi:hypothetical protein